MTTTLAETVAGRVAGKPASRARALFASGAAAVAAGVLVYKLLRSGEERND
jgi:hypothetical protein